MPDQLIAQHESRPLNIHDIRDRNTSHSSPIQYRTITQQQ